MTKGIADQFGIIAAVHLAQNFAAENADRAGADQEFTRDGGYGFTRGEFEEHLSLTRGEIDVGQMDGGGGVTPRRFCDRFAGEERSSGLQDGMFAGIAGDVGATPQAYIVIAQCGILRAAYDQARQVGEVVHEVAQSFQAVLGWVGDINQQQVWGNDSMRGGYCASGRFSDSEFTCGFEQLSQGVSADAISIHQHDIVYAH